MLHAVGHMHHLHSLSLSPSIPRHGCPCSCAAGSVAAAARSHRMFDPGPNIERQGRGSLIQSGAACCCWICSAVPVLRCMLVMLGLEGCSQSTACTRHAALPGGICWLCWISSYLGS
jgi:hypothetical protein